MSVKTCPKCDALIAPQLERCRRCGTYLHGTRAEGVLLKILPDPLRASPGTGLMFVAIVLVYLAVAVLSLPGSPLSFSSYSLNRLGSMQPGYILSGEWWRVVTSMFLHGGVVHVAFNLYALVQVGPLVEEYYDRKKMLLLYLVAGVASMATSFVFSTFVMPERFPVASVGASGAVSGLIAAAWVGAKHASNHDTTVAHQMRRWTIAMVVFGLLVPGIDNAAHAGGFVMGGLLARIIPVGLTTTVARQRVLSVILGLSTLFVLACAGLTLQNARSFPGALDRDAQPTSVLVFDISAGTAWEDSDQVRLSEDCLRIFRSTRTHEEKVQACEMARLALPGNPFTVQLLSDLAEQSGDSASARRLAAVAQRTAGVRD